LRERDDGVIQYTQVTANADDPAGGGEIDRAFQARLAEESGRPFLYNAIVINDAFPEVFRTQLSGWSEVNAKGIRVFAGIVGAHRRQFTFEDWNCSSERRMAQRDTWNDRGEEAKLADPSVRAALKQEYDSGAFHDSRDRSCPSRSRSAPTSPRPCITMNGSASRERRLRRSARRWASTSSTRCSTLGRRRPEDRNGAQPLLNTRRNSRAK
jgi:hypothetical protein